MEVSRREFFKHAGAAAALLGLSQVHVAEAQGLEFDSDLHFLNRLSWSARVQDVERLQRLGKEAYLEEQLHPETLDDALADELLGKLPLLSMDRRTLHGLDNSNSRAKEALVKGMLVRAVYSERQLFERMAEFWSDHFHISLDADAPADLILFQRDVIRKHALGNFRDLLLGSAKSAAMLVYLDNFVNIASSPNENYARELLELHTLGVDGGYSEKDVKEVARAFTGWTLHDNSPNGFYFNGKEHDEEPKEVLGHQLPSERGIEDGLQVLSIVASHPETAKFICHKLCVRFVSDQPPASLLAHLAKVWQEHKGEIKPVLRALFLSREFAESQGQKLRRPLDFFIGIRRATGTGIRHWWDLEAMLTELGQFPYAWGPPNGYPDTAGAWVSTGGLLSRWNTAMRLTHGALSDPEWGRGLQTDIGMRLPPVATVKELVAEVSMQVFARRLSERALEPFIAFASDGAGGLEPVTRSLLSRKLGSLYGLMLISPQYQWR